MTETTIATIVAKLEKTMQCSCDLDRWEPTKETGHSWVCQIHKAALAEAKKLGVNPWGTL